MKKLLLGLATVAIVIAGVALISAYEAHIINVTAHIENALSVDTYGIDFGTVFPQEDLEKEFTVKLSDSFRAQVAAEGAATTVSYEIIQKAKPWTLNFGEGDVDAHNRSLVCIDPDTANLGGRCVIANNVLTINTDNDVEDLYGPGETDPGTDWTAPRMVIPMGGNFTIETKVIADPHQYPSDPYQAGGILVYQNDGNVVRLELTAFSGLNSNAVYMESQEDAVKTGKAWSAIGDQDYVWLRLSRNGQVFTGEYSTDGIKWYEVTLQYGDFVNEKIGNQPMVGLSATDNLAESSFSASFDYVTFNGRYLGLCRFLSKTKAADETEEGDVNEESYFNGYDEEGGCSEKKGPATGTLSANDLEDTWIVDLKVPPVAGFVGQDWPETCADFVVQENDLDYGCDLWIKVINIERVEPKVEE